MKGDSKIITTDFKLGGEKVRGHAGHVIRLAKELANGEHPGVLATIDGDGVPRLRWMGTLSLKEFPHLYAVTSSMSRKIAEIGCHPHVCWMFTSNLSTMVVKLSGKARVITDGREISRIWQLIENKSTAFFLGLKTTSEGLAVIDTIIENIECVAPRYDLHYAGDPG